MSEFHYCRTIGVDGGVDAVNGPAIGIDLESILEGGLPPFKAALEIVAALCEILDIADQDGEVHGDLAPDWIFLDDTGAVSIEGFGVKRDETMAPEGRPRGTATDLYGLGYVAYRLFAVEDLDEVDLDEPDAHDDDVIDAVVQLNFEGLPDEIVGDIQWFIAKLMSFDREDRPPALEAWRSFIAFADMVDGMPLDEWGVVAVEGGGDRRDAEEAARPPEPPDEAADEDLGGPVLTKGPLSRGGLSFGGAGAKPGQATAFWSKEQMKAALEAEDEEEEFRPQAAASTSFWSRADMEAMARGDTEAPRPKRGGGQAQNRATMMVARSDMDRAETEKKRQHRAAPPKAPPPTPAAPAPPVARHVPPPSAPAAPPPAAPPPVIQQTSAPPAAAPPPVIQGPQVQQPAWEDDEDTGGGNTKFIIIGVVVLLLLVCGGVVVVGGGFGVFFGMSGNGDVPDVDIEEPDEPDEPDARGTKDTAPEEVPVEEPDEPAPKPSRSGSSSSRPSTPSTSSPSTSSSPSSVRPSTTSTPSSVRPSTSVRPGTRPTPPPADGPVKGTVKTTQRGQLRCSDGQQVDVDGSLTLEFEPHTVPVTCMVIIDGKMGAVQFERTQAFTCQVGGDEVSCR